MLSMRCCDLFGNAADVVLSLPRPSESHLFDIVGSSGIVRSGFRGSGAGLAHITVKVKASFLIVVDGKVLLFFIYRLGFELFNREV